MTYKILAIGAALLVLAACDGLPVAKADKTPVVSSAGDAAAGKAIFDSYCVTCHGKGGQGDGPLSQDLPTAPADLTMLSEVNDGAFPSERVMAQIYGYPGRYHRGLMPEFGPMLDGPMVEWTSPEGEKLMTPKALLDLVSYLQSLQQ
ncbi:c-type cytochrome [Tropicibacter naphthalenivorans]|uniref:Cytochrome c, mono-and diheme variants n=1 Tax=Tropicibacter naphthalenivorans TaxID=441103 RepID=A0A0P1GI38_9RHOB|nr:c-type cytochrome [Tropicibacter naphthalenivorans]CUH81462.1 Cytochrome c, mono-and diheme variants [Tropicibacter naphthalenivorans]SMD00321.1 Cytochrome c, mono-and diheme variants [Tropicibacter naphthalenivorans]